MTRRFVLGSFALALAGAAALPLLAQDTKGEQVKTHEVMFDKPLAEVIPLVDKAIRDEGLVCIADIDWSRVGSMREPPADGAGTPRLDEAGGSLMVHTYIVDMEECVKKIGEHPQHALDLPGRFVIYEKDGKACGMALRPYAKIMALGVEVPEMLKTHLMETEKKLEKILEDVKAGSR